MSSHVVGLSNIICGYLHGYITTHDMRESKIWVAEEPCRVICNAGAGLFPTEMTICNKVLPVIRDTEAPYVDFSHIDGDYDWYVQTLDVLFRRADSATPGRMNYCIDELAVISRLAANEPESQVYWNSQWRKAIDHTYQMAVS